MSKNNDKELLNKIGFSKPLPILPFRFNGADFHLRGEGDAIHYASKSRLSCFLRLKNCKLSSNVISLNAHVEILPFEEYIKTYFEEELSRSQENLFKKLEWKKYLSCTGDMATLLTRKHICSCIAQKKNSNSSRTCFCIMQLMIDC